jgi:hypothetical protein
MFQLYSSNAIVPNRPIWTSLPMLIPAPWKIRIPVDAASSSLCQDAFGSRPRPAGRLGSEIPKEAAGPTIGPATPLLSDNLNLDFDANLHDYLRQKVEMLSHR